MAKVSGPTQPSGSPPPQVEETGHHVDHLLLSCAKFKNEWSHIYTPVVFSGKEMDRFTLIKYGIYFFSSPDGLIITVKFCRVIVLSDNCRLPLPVTFDCINTTHSSNCPHVVE